MGEESHMLPSGINADRRTIGGRRCARRRQVVARGQRGVV